MNFEWNRTRDHRGILDKVQRGKEAILKRLKTFLKYDDVIKVVEWGEVESFNNGVLTVAEQPFGVFGPGRLMRNYQKLPVEARNRTAFELAFGHPNDIDYAELLAKPLERVAQKWDEFKNVAPKVKLIRFKYRPEEFQYNPYNQSVIFPVGRAQRLFDEKIFDESLEKLKKVNR